MRSQIGRGDSHGVSGSTYAARRAIVERIVARSGVFRGDGRVQWLDEATIVQAIEVDGVGFGDSRSAL